MDEVWNDISLSSSLRPSSAVHHSLDFQDFLNHPSSANDGGAPVTALSLGTGGSTSLQSPAFAKKRALYGWDLNEEERHKRLMKNRESADRSRARKQAYTKELENEVARLKKENVKLKGQLKKINMEDNSQLPKKNTLQRTLTAPF